MISCKKDVSFENSSTPTTDEVSPDADSAGRLRLTSTYVRKNLLFDYTAESTDALLFYWNTPSKYWHQKYAYSSSSVTRSNVVSRSGGYSVKYVLNKSDGMVASGKRAETYRNPRGETSAKVERWYGVSIFLPSDFAYDTSPEIVTQWHSLLSYGGPELAVWTASGTWRIVQLGKISVNIGSYERNKWTDFVFHVKWSSGTDGVLEVWKNGVKVVGKTGQTMPSGLSYAPYFRTGIYKWHWNTGSKTPSLTTRRTIYVDEMRVGNAYATYADVKPGS